MMDYIPLASIAINVFDAYQKNHPSESDPTKSLENRYFKNMKDKSYGRCAALVFIPILGNIAVFCLIKLIDSEHLPLSKKNGTEQRKPTVS